ncbi:MAG: plasmid pRiA4b ORF-3 family protein [Chitinivibrionales bacterium]|nr:plasmid pRiA4b ORF-3 family protein [Chitinivibrionales bacterium]
MENMIIQMKIVLEGIVPKIWRSFVVESSISLANLHEIIQIVMGWENMHLYSFSIFGAEAAKKIKLHELNLKTNSTIGYLYDFGDEWEHTITVEKIISSDKKIKTPRCIAGARNCPPEDSGSVPGYEDIVDAMKRPKSGKAREYIEWLGDVYNPAQFDIKEINKKLD